MSHSLVFELGPDQKAYGVTEITLPITLNDIRKHIVAKDGVDVFGTDKANLIRLAWRKGYTITPIEATDLMKTFHCAADFVADGDVLLMYELQSQLCIVDQPINDTPISQSNISSHRQPSRHHHCHGSCINSSIGIEPNRSERIAV